MKLHELQDEEPLVWTQFLKLAQGERTVFLIARPAAGGERILGTAVRGEPTLVPGQYSIFYVTSNGTKLRLNVKTIQLEHALVKRRPDIVETKGELCLIVSSLSRLPTGDD